MGDARVYRSNWSYQKFTLSPVLIWFDQSFAIIILYHIFSEFQPPFYLFSHSNKKLGFFCATSLKRVFFSESGYSIIRIVEINWIVCLEEAKMFILFDGKRRDLREIKRKRF